MNTATDQLARMTRPRIQLDPPLIELTDAEAEGFDALVLCRLQRGGGLAADARVEVVREVLAAGLVVVAGATGLEKSRALTVELASRFREDRRLSYEERQELVKLATALGTALAVIQAKDRDIAVLGQMVRGETGI